MIVHRLPEDIERTWHSPRQGPFRIHGLYRPDLPGKFRRMPESAAAQVSESVLNLSANTAGGRVRFVTDSPFVAIRASLSDTEQNRMDHITCCAVYGFDLYVKVDGREVYFGTFRPTTDARFGYESLLNLPGGVQEVTINFPLYNNVEDLHIGLKPGCALSAASHYPNPLPIVFYGSSITQGGCASRPGNCYTAIVGRMLNIDTLNLGFSGSGRGEEAMAKYLADLPMAAFVCDYDHNAPDPEHLLATHARFYRTVRDAQPNLPILLVSKPDVDWDDGDADARRAVILATYEGALADGDRRIAFLDGKTLFDGFMRDSCTVDGCHPNDLGMMRMAEKIGACLESLLN